MSNITQPNTASNNYRIDLDIIKAISIIAVVFYHVGWLDTGYLGVDIFFAINGFLIIPSLIKHISEGSFSYPKFLLKRIMRLWPLVLLAGIVCLVVGYVAGMLPDDYENLSQSVVASDFMSQNVLSAITTKNYWDTSNEYKPLMHFWYVGILVELYVVLPLILLLVKSITKKVKANFARISFIALLVLAFVSFVLYLSPSTSIGDRFYLLPYRLWELILGGLVGLVAKRVEKNSNNILGYAAIVVLILILSASLYLPHEANEINAVSGRAMKTMLVPQNVLLILSVLLTCILLDKPIKIRKTKIGDIFTMIGKMSFSIFVWHQI
jgi:peptidoglycan/LPS O-acetylase OafA/YrhL